MLQSGELVRCRGSKAASSEAETRSGGPGPSSEEETHSRGRHSPEGMSSPRAKRRFTWGCPPLERDRGSPEGCRGWLLDGLLRFFGPWALLCSGL
jgi:hypothetical protein